MRTCAFYTEKRKYNSITLNPLIIKTYSRNIIFSYWFLIILFILFSFFFYYLFSCLFLIGVLIISFDPIILIFLLFLKHRLVQYIIFYYSFVLFYFGLADNIWHLLVKATHRKSLFLNLVKEQTYIKLLYIES